MDNIAESIKKLTKAIEKQNELINGYFENNQRTLNLLTAQLKLQIAKREIFEKNLLDKL